jgi:hypothetical protein
MKIREVLNLSGRDLEKDSGLSMSDLIRPMLAPIPLENQVISSRRPAVSDDTPIAADSVGASGTEPPPQVGRGPAGTPPRWEMDRVKAQVARLPRGDKGTR